jgi:hypothetical protein
MVGTGILHFGCCSTLFASRPYKIPIKSDKRVELRDIRSNAADFQRYAKKPFDTIPGNAIGFPMSNLLVYLVGNVICASSQQSFGQIVWNPVEPCCRRKITRPRTGMFTVPF